MIAELAAFNAAFGVVKQFIGNGKDLSRLFRPNRPDGQRKRRFESSAAEKQEVFV
jgi:hypothetical protein